MIDRRGILLGGGSLAATAFLPLPGLAADTTRDADLHAFFKDVFERDMARNPLRALALGRRQGYDALDDVGEAHAVEDDALDAADLAKLARDFPLDRLSPQGRLQARLFRDRTERARAAFRWRTHALPLTLTGGPHTGLPVQLINQHKVESVGDAEAYIARLRQFPRYFTQVVDRLDRNAAAGVLPPRFFFPTIIAAVQGQVTGRPYTDGPADSPLFADLKTKIGALPVAEEERNRLLAAAESALKQAVRPAYGRLLAWLVAAETKAGDEHGVWRLPRGEAYYRHCLQQMTTLPLTAAEVHRIGLNEVSRIHGEMVAIMRRVGFSGSLTDFFAFLREDEQFFYPDSAEGRAAYLKDATQFIDGMRTKLDDWFGLQPKAALEVRQVEPFREKGAPSAFYNAPSSDGTRPGIFYVNLGNMRARPRYGLETLAYHEGLPGHHMQIAIAQELEGVPDFQRFGPGYAAFAEGWALYTEALAKEMGFFQDPYSDFGRLNAELWRAVRLVVDTGLHALRWDRERAIAYFLANTPMEVLGAGREVDRYIGNPGQAVSYKVGMIHIQRLRDAAQAALGDRFDIRGFHDAVLRNGSVPLGLLTEEVGRWAGLPA